MTPTPLPLNGAPELLPCPFCGKAEATMYPPTCNKSTPYNPADRAAPVVRCSCGASKFGNDWDQIGKSAIEAWNRRAAIQQAAGAVPEGWKLVPIEPDGAMWSASRREFIRFANKYEDAPDADKASVWADVAGPDIYRAMLAAAQPVPSAPVQPDSGHLGAGGRVPLSDEQCDAIYNALNDWARDVDPCDFGLPLYSGGGAEGGRAIIRAAHGINPGSATREDGHGS